MGDLRLGAKILREHINLETEKSERAARAKANEKANIAAAAERVNCTSAIVILGANTLPLGQTCIY